MTSIIPESIKAIVKEEQDGQDIIIQIEEKNVFYIEVKSRWLENSPIRMSKNQTLRANSEKGRYALCSVDMVGYTGDNKYDIQDVEEIKNITRFNIDIGDRVKHLIEILNQSKEEDEIPLASPGVSSADFDAGFLGIILEILEEEARCYE